MPTLISQEEKIMKITVPLVAALALGFVSAPALAKSRQHQHPVAYASGGPGFQGGVLRGPLYNGQDYLGNDPDPNIRSYLLRDLSGRYGGGR